MTLAVDSLPTDLAAAHAMIIAKHEALLAAEARASAAESEAEHRALLIEKLKYTIAKLRREKFGQSSERGAILEQLELALAELQAAPGRGAPITIELSGGLALLLDESYNANPASVEAALAVLGRSVIGPQGRRIAVLGDMLELGPTGLDLHRGLADAVVANDIDLVFCCGPMMHALWHALPANRRGGYAEDSAALEAQVLPAIRAGDVVMVKGSLGSHMAPIVKALQRAYPRYETMANASVQG